MATFTELNGLLNDSVLSERVGVACIVAAKDIASEGDGVSNHANRLKWAKRVFTNPTGERVNVMRYVLARNTTETLEDIAALTDSELQDFVNAGINIFADGS